MRDYRYSTACVSGNVKVKIISTYLYRLNCYALNIFLLCAAVSQRRQLSLKQQTSKSQLALINQFLPPLTPCQDSDSALGLPVMLVSL